MKYRSKIRIPQKSLFAINAIFVIMVIAVSKNDNLHGRNYENAFQILVALLRLGDRPSFYHS